MSVTAPKRVLTCCRACGAGVQVSLLGGVQTVMLKQLTARVSPQEPSWEGIYTKRVP